MKLSLLPTVVVAAACAHGAAALNVVFYESSTCRGTFRTVCLGLARDTCCAHTRGERINCMEFQGVDTSQNVELRSYNGGRCSHRSADDGSQGRGTISFVREPPYTGAGWGGFSRKRGDDAVETLKSVRPQLLEFTEGTQFNLTSLSDDDYYEM
jgi:hypothetical protein